MRPSRLTLLLAIGAVACSTTEIAPQGPPEQAPPQYLAVPHPAGYDTSDLTAMFLDKNAPTEDAVKGCDASFRKLHTMTPSVDERRQGVRELVRNDPVGLHWCFYGKLHYLEHGLKAEPFIDVRQKSVLATYEFLTPIARAYMTEFHDSRYMRWAVRHYKKVSEWMFYRKLELSPQATSELVEAANPFGPWREIDGRYSILEKYGIVSKPMEVSAAVAAPALKKATFTEDKSPVPTAPTQATVEVAPAGPAAATLPATEPSGTPEREPANAQPANTKPGAPLETPSEPPPAEGAPASTEPPAATQPAPPASTEPAAPPPAQAPSSSGGTEAVLNGDEVTPVNK